MERHDRIRAAADDHVGAQVADVARPVNDGSPGQPAPSAPQLIDPESHTPPMGNKRLLYIATVSVSTLFPGGKSLLNSERCRHCPPASSRGEQPRQLHARRKDQYGHKPDEERNTRFHRL